MKIRNVMSHQCVKSNIEQIKDAGSLISTVRLVVVTTMLAALTSACGGMKTNPTEGYEDLRDAGKPQPTAMTKPQIMAEAVFRRPSVANDTIPLNFQEGRSSAYTFDAGCFYDGVTYNLVAKNLPPGALFTRSTDPKKQDQFILSWNPTVGSITAAEHGHRTMSFQIMYEITSTPNAEAAALVMPLNRKEYSYQVNLFNNEQDPEITKMDLNLGGLDTITHGDKVAITIEAVDPGAYRDRVPTLKVEDDNGGASDTNVIRAANYVTFGSASLVNGKFVFKAVFDSAKFNFPSSIAEVTARFKVFIKGVAGHRSAVLPVNIKVIKKPEPPKSEPLPAKKGSVK